MAVNFDQSMLDLDTGLLDGTIIQMETIEDTFEKAITRYDYPYADGADLEDMGQKAHSIRFKCYFWDDAEQQSYDTHTLLLDSLADKGLLDFVHPKYGLLKGKIESIVVMHDDSIRKATLDISFVEQMRAALSVAQPQSLLSGIEAAYIQNQVDQADKLAADIALLLPAADAGAGSKTLDAATGLLSQVQEFSNSTRFFVAAVERHIATAEAIVTQVESPVNSLQATITYSLSLPGRILGSISRAVEKLARLNDSIWNYPVKYLTKLNDAMDDLDQALADLAATPQGAAAAEIMRNHLTIACAQRIALEAAAIYAADEQAIADGSSDFQVMNIRELEASLAIVRARIAAAVEIAREMESLKTMAATLLTQVNSVRLEREKMIAVTLDNPMPLHLVCLKYGLPYTDAERLLKVNRNIQNPNCADGEVFVYAR